MNTDEKAIKVITGLELDPGVLLDGVDAELIIYTLKHAGIELFEAAPAKEASQ